MCYRKIRTCHVTIKPLGYTLVKSNSTGCYIVDEFRRSIFKNGIQKTAIIDDECSYKTARAQKIRYRQAYCEKNACGGTETLTIYLYNIKFLGEVAQ